MHTVHTQRGTMKRKKRVKKKSFKPNITMNVVCVCVCVWQKSRIDRKPKYWNTLQINAIELWFALLTICVPTNTHTHNYRHKEVSRKEIRTNKHTQNNNGQYEWQIKAEQFSMANRKCTLRKDNEYSDFFSTIFSSLFWCRDVQWSSFVERNSI